MWRRDTDDASGGSWRSPRSRRSRSRGSVQGGSASAPAPRPGPHAGRVDRRGRGQAQRARVAGLRGERQRPTRPYNWVKPFEDATGCKTTVQVFGTSDEAFQLFTTNPEQYDVISASGDASRAAHPRRLRPAGERRPARTRTPDIIPALKDKPWNTVDGVHYGIPHGRGPNLLMYRTDEITTEPTSAGRPLFDPSGPGAGSISVYDAPIYIADAAVVPDGDQARPRHQEPVRAGRHAVPGGRRPAQGAASAHQGVLDGLPEADGLVPATATSTIGHDLAAPAVAARGRGLRRSR